METEDLSNLGMRDYTGVNIPKIDRSKERNGFVAGVAYAEALSDAKKVNKPA